MSVYWNERTRNLEPYTPGEQPRGRAFIKLNTNENPYPPSPATLEALRKAACGDLRLYPDPACTEFREAAAARFGVRSSQVFAGNGSDEVLAFAFGAFFDAALPVLFPDISYSFYPVYARLWDIPYRTVPLREDFSIDYRDYTALPGGVVIPNPNAPTGRALPCRELLAIARSREDSGARRGVVIADEAYIAFADEGEYRTAVSCINEYPNLLVVHTLSKAASLAGLRVGFAIGGEELIQGLCALRDSFNSYTLDRLALAGATAALNDAAYYRDINQKIIATRKRSSDVLLALGFETLPSQANFIFVRHPEKSGGAFFMELREKGILVRHFNKARISDYVRVSIGNDADMDAFLEACRQSLTRVQRGGETS
jgi:histidinol-phosphate aminotransferase